MSFDCATSYDLTRRQRKFECQGHRSSHSNSICALKDLKSKKSISLKLRKNLACPKEFHCPLSKELMRDPVIVTSGLVFRHQIDARSVGVTPFLSSQPSCLTSRFHVSPSQGFLGCLSSPFCFCSVILF
ncbi:hypothetical protein CsSME_00042751 [Camellia sinensis var. sinensis]